MNTTNVTRETLAKQMEEAKAKFNAANDALKKDMESIFSNWISKKGISSYCSFRADDDGYGELRVTACEKSYSLTMRYAKGWKDDGSVRYELSMNYSGFGAITDSEEVKVKYAIVIGLVASDLTSLQVQLSHLNWVHVRELERIFTRAESALEDYDYDAEKREHDRKVAEVLPLIKVGAKFKDKYGVVSTIVSVNRKYIDFDYISQRLTREEIADMVISGELKASKRR